MGATAADRIARLLAERRRGDEATERLGPFIYRGLETIAVSHRRAGRAAHALRPAFLVSARTWLLHRLSSREGRPSGL